MPKYEVMEYKKVTVEIESSGYSIQDLTEAAEKGSQILEYEGMNLVVTQIDA